MSRNSLYTRETIEHISAVVSTEVLSEWWVLPFAVKFCKWLHGIRPFSMKVVYTQTWGACEKDEVSGGGQKPFSCCFSKRQTAEMTAALFPPSLPHMLRPQSHCRLDLPLRSTETVKPLPGSRFVTLLLITCKIEPVNKNLLGILWL